MSHQPVVATLAGLRRNFVKGCIHFRPLWQILVSNAVLSSMVKC